jgi:hypothetical protein
MLPQTAERYEAAFEHEAAFELVDGASFAGAVEAGRALSPDDATSEALQTFGG